MYVSLPANEPAWPNHVVLPVCVCMCVCVCVCVCVCMHKHTNLMRASCARHDCAMMAGRVTSVCFRLTKRSCFGPLTSHKAPSKIHCSISICPPPPSPLLHTPPPPLPSSLRRHLGSVVASLPLFCCIPASLPFPVSASFAHVHSQILHRILMLRLRT